MPVRSDRRQICHGHGNKTCAQISPLRPTLKFDELKYIGSTARTFWEQPGGISCARDGVNAPCQSTAVSTCRQLHPAAQNVVRPVRWDIGLSVVTRIVVSLENSIRGDPSARLHNPRGDACTVCRPGEIIRKQCVSRRDCNGNGCRD